MTELKYIYFQLPEHIHFLFINKCKYNDMPTQEVISLAVEKFINGDYDEELGLIKNDSELPK